MAIEANYYISAVRYNSAETHIDRVRVHPNQGQGLGQEVTWMRDQVISTIERGYTCATMFKRDEKWVFGAWVRIVKVNGIKYLRTDGNARASDNLENLPRF